MGDEPVVASGANDAGQDTGTDRSDATDGSGDADAAVPECDLSKPFGSPAQLVGTSLNTSGFESEATLTSDELTMFFVSNRGLYLSNGVGNQVDLYVATRPK